MQPRKCAECGAEFTPTRPNQKYCSKQCSRNAYAWRSRESYEAREAEHALAVSAPVANSTIMTARRKPKNTSAVRWRIELSRRANPNHYAMAEGIF